MYEPLHHKYRPQTFADLVGQEAIATTLTNAILSQRIAPAYLFTGPRGTGKTSSARILAKSLNCQSSERPTPTPCGKCDVCRAIAIGSALDVIEIDAASNTGVDNIREIIERSQFAPVQCRYKIYTIDECHMLSTAAFNALLKTLEEPPQRVIFILATTDPQRVLPTIISRCQRFDYRRIPLDAMVWHLKNIADKESIEIDDEAITLVAQIANGGLRDAQSLLDQLSLLSGKVTSDRVWDLVGSVAERDLLKLLGAIASDRPESVIEQCRHLMNQGREPLVVLQNLASFYLNLLLAKTAPTRSNLVAVTSTTWQALCEEAPYWELETILRGQQHLKESESQIKNTTQPRLWLEVALLGLLPSAYRSPTAIAPSLPTSPQVSLSRRTTQPFEVGSNASAGNISTSLPKPPQENPRSSPSVEKEEEPQQPTPEPIRESPEPKLEERSEETIIPIASTEQIPTKELWQAIVDRVQPFTQVLVRSNCYLMGMDEHTAYLGVKNQSLLEMVKGKIAEIETAFKVVVGHRVNVNLQVVTPDDSKSFLETKSSGDNYVKKETEEKIQTTDAPEIRPIEKPLEPPPPKQPLLSVVSEPIVQNKKSPETQSKTIEVQNDLTVELDKPEIELSDRNENAIPDYVRDELQKAAQYLAKSFEGEIIDWDRFIDENPLATNQQETSLPDPNILVENEPETPQPLPDHQQILRERLDLSKFTDEEDIPF
ncbi:DNA polymerase III subunit gamma/tau [Candidatus Gracilibacteria bacterium]|nr:DNA polymerase III subunit gamma/tau [Candidatus Gracilibacteria bacterium]